MPRLDVPPRDDAPEDARGLLDQVHAQLGLVPGIFRLMASSPATLKGYMGLSAAVGEVVDVKLRERISLALAQVTGCDYCLSAHNYRAINLARIGPEEIELSRRGGASCPRAAAAVRFALAVFQTGGKVADADLAEVRSAGFTDPQIVEIVALVALNLFANYLAQVAALDIDYPVVRSAELA